MRRDRALHLLSQCRGDEIWSVQHCLEQGIPEDWIEQLADAFESGYQTDSQTIYENGKMTNQYHGIRDLDLAIQLASSLGVNTKSLQLEWMDRQTAVQAIKDAILEG